MPKKKIKPEEFLLNVAEKTVKRRIKKSELFIYPKNSLLLDMDGVWANFTQRLIDEYNKRHNGNIKVEQWTSFEAEDVFGEAVWEKMEDIYNEEGFFTSIEPYPGALEIVRDVVKLVPTEICSAPTKRYFAHCVKCKKDHPKSHRACPDCGDPTDERKKLNPHAAYEKFEWVHTHMPVLSNNITLSVAKYKIAADFLVDDGIHNIAQWCRAHPKGRGFVVAQPWNEGVKLPWNATRGPLAELPEFVKSKLSRMTD